MAPLQDTEKDEDELSFDDLNDDDEIIEKPEKVDKKPETYIQKIPRKNHIKAGEELNKCLTEDPAKGHPHLVKTDIQDVAEVLITHTKAKPEHVHKFGDIPEEVQKEVESELKMEGSLTVSTTTLVEDDQPRVKLGDISLDRKRRNAERPTKVRLPKLKIMEKKRDDLSHKKQEIVKTENDADKPKPEPISIPLHEVAGFDKIKKKVKRDTDSTIVKRSSFVRPKPVSEILKHHAIQSTHHKKEE